MRELRYFSQLARLPTNRNKLELIHNLRQAMKFQPYRTGDAERAAYRLIDQLEKQGVFFLPRYPEWELALTELDTGSS